MPENVLVVKNKTLEKYLNSENGCLITEHNEQVFNNILDDHFFMPRDAAEYDFEHKQVIPYVITRDKSNYLLLKRTTNQAEKRLHNKFSLGIGGHINPDSSTAGENIIIKSLYRELNEEVLIHDPADMSFVGIINDERNSVSRVHLGLLYVLDVLSPKYEVLETDKMTAGWISEGDLSEYYEGLETWSQIVYDNYINKK